MKFDKDTMRKRFWELYDQKKTLEKNLAPLRQKRKEFQEKLRPLVQAYKELKQDVIAVERPLMGEIDMEMAVIARALGNKVGPRANG